MPRGTAPIVLGALLVFGALAGCGTVANHAMSMDASAQDFEQLWEYDRPAETEARFRVELARHAQGTEAHAQLLTQIARTLGLRRQFDQAHRLLDQVESQLAATGAKVRVRYQLERGRAFNSAGDKVRAHALFLAAWTGASAAELDFYAIDAAHMMAFVTPPAQQHEWNLKALALAERTPDPRARKWLASLYNNIGWTFHDEKDYTAALAMFEKALSAAEERGLPGPVRIAKWTVARCLRSLGRHDEALQRQLALRDAPTAGSASDGYVFEELGENLLALGRPLEARPNFAKAHALLRENDHLKATAPARLARLRELGEVLSQ